MARHVSYTVITDNSAGEFGPWLKVDAVGGTVSFETTAPEPPWDSGIEYFLIAESPGDIRVPRIS